jgi:hypothetical protein
MSIIEFYMNIVPYFSSFMNYSSHLKRRQEEETMRIYEQTMKNDTTDDEAKRHFYRSKIQWWINTALDDLKYLHGKKQNP